MSDPIEQREQARAVHGPGTAQVIGADPGGDGIGKKKAWGLAGALLLVGVAALLLFRYLKDEPEEKPPPPSAPIVETAAVEIGGGALRVQTSGTVQAQARVELAAQVGGRVVQMAPALEAGGRVRAGQVLVRIDPADYRNRVEQARAGVEQQRVAVLQAEEEAAIARREFDRFRQREDARAGALSATRFLTPADTGTASAPGAGSSAGYGEPSALALRQPQLDAAGAQLRRAEAELEDARLALSRTAVTAPFAALVQSSQVDLGALVQPGQALATLVAADAVEVTVPLTDDEAVLLPELWALEAGSSDRRIPAAVFADYGGLRYRWDGYADRVEAALDPESRTINAVIRVPDPFRGGRLVGNQNGEGLRDGPTLRPVAPPPLLIGRFVDVEIEGAALERYVVVPRRALQRGDEVYAVRQDSVLRVVPVQVLQRRDGEVVVDGPLRQGDRVVVSDLSVATDGMAVRRAAAMRRDSSGTDR